MTPFGRALRRLTALALLLAFGALPLADAAEEKAPPPPQPPPAESLRTFEHPSDDGHTINIEWGPSSDEAADVYYVIEIASEADAKLGKFQRVAKLPSLQHLKSDEKRFYDYDDPMGNVRNRKVHYFAVLPAKFLVPAGDDPDDNAGNREPVGPVHLRLAIFRMGKKTELRKKEVPPPKRGKDEEDEQEPPVLARAREQHAELVGQLQGFHGFLSKLDASLKAADRPTLTTASYLDSLSPIDGQIPAMVRLVDDLLDTLRELDSVREGGDPKAELEAWEKAQREKERKAAEERAKREAEKPPEEQTEVEVDVEGALAYVMDGGRPKILTATPASPPLVRPDAAGFRAFDLPSDKGDTIAIEWPRSPAENGRTTYVLEIAEVKDGKPGEFKKAKTVPSLGAGKDDQPKHFGFRTRNRRVHLLPILPATLFPTDKKKQAADLRKAAVEAELKWMPKGFLPDPDYPKHVAALTASIGDYFEGLKAIGPILDAVDKPGYEPLAKLDGPLRAALTSYSAYAKLLKRFEGHVAKQLAKRTDKARREVGHREYAFRLSINRGGEQLYLEEGGSPKTVVASARVNWFKGYKVNNLIFSLVFCAVVGAFIQRARRNPNLFIRKIAGLDAVEEAIGRATEMGRSAFFVHGLGGMGELPTIAAVNILARVARRAAEYDTRIRVMNCAPIVMAVSQEVVKQAYTEAGRPDAYSDDDVAMVASGQFSYAAAVGGRMVREQPAAIFLMGSFAAESLLLAETGASTGAIQIAGTDSYTQIPFFITTCDYTLIGEELYAASAYLSREPRMLGSLRGQDVGKAFMMLVILAFTALATAGNVLQASLPKLNEFAVYLVKTLFQPFA